MSEPIRVAIVCDYLLDYLGGAQTALLEQARALAAAGHEVILIAPATPFPEPTTAPFPEPTTAPFPEPTTAPFPEPVEGQSTSRPESTGFHLIKVPFRVTLPGLRLPVITNSAELRSRLRAWFREHRIEMVHLHSEFGLAAAAVDVAGELGLPVVHSVHTFFWQSDFPAQRALAAAVDRFHGRLTGWPRDRPTAVLADRPGDAALRTMTWRMARRARLVISPSAHQAERLRAAGITRLRVIPNTLTGQSEPAEPPPARPVKIIWAGRCGPEKRLLPFVRGAVRALDRVGAGRLAITIAGDGEQLPAARRIARDHPAITFLGRRPHAEIVRLLHDHHLLALTSYGFDNQPMSIVEAILAGRGVLYCDPRLTEGTTNDDRPAAGILTDGPDEASWTERLIELAEDPGRAAAACQAAVTTRAIFRPETFLTKITAAYRSVAVNSAGLGSSGADSRLHQPPA
ncbi:glycosyltransferase [Microlunatus speluncae]|uniref:glycosyltransferase n=1 Tax=Microlunatus speluncae TaxID=2594267 RepID=UPI0012666D97|nr:glycosyltransferase [Microlunatus speluncae]